MTNRIELRSDTFTKPTAGMLEAMFAAQVGDDVFSEDPTVNELEEYMANLFGMEAAVFCPSGTMTNQIAMRCHTQPGDEIICEKNAHVFAYEGGGMASNSGCQARLIEGERGLLAATEIEKNINPEDLHKAHTALVCLENTSNRGGGSCYDFEEIKRIENLCRKHNLKLHLDGARLFNALVAKNETPKQYGEVFDSISICLSKGLGAPVGSVLLGNKAFIYKARRVRKAMGGGMRQAGYIAAGALYAIKNNMELLTLDHKHAQQLSAKLNTLNWVENVAEVETNIVIFKVKSKFDSAKNICEKLNQQKVFCLPVSDSEIRMVTHLGVSAEQINVTCEILSKLQ